MIVIMRTKAQADKVANLTGGQVIPDSKGQPTSRVSLSGDFEQYHSAIESVSVLFQLCDDVGEKVSSGWTMTGASFEVEWPKDPERVTCIRSHFGARRYTYNWALARVKSDLETKSKNPDYEFPGSCGSSCGPTSNSAK